MRVDAAGVALHVDDHAGRGVPLVLVHGFAGSAASWEPVLPALREGRRVVVPELVGHARSDAPASLAPYRIEAVARQLVAVLDARGIAQADWVGYSLGGRVALTLALAAPQRVRRLVLASCSAGLRDDPERAARRAADEVWAERALKEGVQAFVDAWLAQPLFATLREDPAMWERARRERLGHTAQGLANALRGMGQGATPPLWDRLAEVAAPTLLVSGARDADYVARMRAMAAAMPQARQELVPGAGHAVHAEQPAAFAAVVRKFLDR
ncbi:MAG TPA: 2-succinyl-6-hydroxy-2,4-cyclohexadiene-1-carboxylate synthase [Candidatus Thermoplasmatota archaeon]|nr:2-succinyl-6-hydroxy-2,4-cyclohexadiene-1-carboxylate synthase [Candidatus Thermoplasmatota archaeon]